MSDFVPIENLRSREEFMADPFFKKVAERAKTKPSYPGLHRRMQHPTCQQCQAEFRKKYPDVPFEPNCEGVYTEEDFQYAAESSDLSYEEAREMLDVLYWAERYIVLKDKDGNFVPYSIESHPFQLPVLQCTAQYQVDRMGRGMGKTTLGVILELQKCFTKPNYEVLVLCPAKAQAQLWYEEINNQIDNSPRLRTSLKNSKQSPYFVFKFGSGSKIKVFTAGSKAGRGAIAIRGQSPRRVRLDEQDYLAEADYDAVMALLRRFPESEFHGSSTPTGARSMYWQMCCGLSEYREFYIPITMKVGWNRELELKYRKEAKTADRYNHEYLALFGDLEAGVFKSITVDAAKKQYRYAEIEYSVNMMEVIQTNWYDCKYNPARNYILGCDWNGKGTGTRIRITEYDPATGIRRCVYKETIDQDGATTDTSLRHIQLLNRLWNLDHIYCDRGFGFAQDELLRKLGRYPEKGFEAHDQRLMRANFVGSKEQLKTNRLVPKRDPNSPYIDDKEMERETKPFMVEGAQIAMEQLRVAISAEDERLEMQMRDYRVKNWSANGQASSYEAKTEGDHDLDAWMLSMLGIELNYGLFFDPNAHNRLAQLMHVSSFGGGVEAKIAAARQRMSAQGVPSRVTQSTKNKEDDWNIVLAQRNGAMIAPSNAGASRAFSVGMRTSIFRNQQTTRERYGKGNRRSY